MSCCYMNDILFGKKKKINDGNDLRRILVHDFYISNFTHKMKNIYLLCNKIIIEENYYYYSKRIIVK